MGSKGGKTESTLMRITEIKPLVCHCYRTNWVFVKVGTDAGIHGVGEATLEYREPTLMEAIRYSFLLSLTKPSRSSFLEMSM